MVRSNNLKKLTCAFLCALILVGCGETEDYSFSRDDVNDFLTSDEDYTGETVEPPHDNAGTDDIGAVSGTDENADETEEKELYIGNLTYEEYEALTLAEQDALRAEERAKMTPPYESQILPEYRELYDYNNAVIGYIYIDGTTIDAPVLQTLEDYEYYLHRDIDGVESEPGCIILDADSEIGIGTAKEGYLEGYEPSTIQMVHGHNMRNGTMFGSLLKYADASYAESHSVIEYDSLYEKRSYEVIGAFYSQIYPEDSDEFKYYTYNQLDSKEEYDHWIENIEELALYLRDVPYQYGDEYILLSTCAYQTEDGRFAVFGVRRE
ncbi:MAG: class B sortase [Lachnospiraceae bacterium]|nr:class B sortase [Lachnospiraceae bacterium]